MDGIAGIYSPGDSDLVNKIFLATGACQHRGKASAGLAVGNEKRLYIHKNLGGIGDVINSEIIRTFQDLEPMAALGNVGYTKNKIPEKRNAEPLTIFPKANSEYDLVLTMDGYLLKEDDLKAELGEDYSFETDNKTEVIGALLHKYITQEGINFKVGEKLLERLAGRATLALVALIYDGKETYMITLNDAKAFEPFCYGIVDGAMVVSSESCSQRRLGGFIEREYTGGEMTICSLKGIETKRLKEEKLLPDTFQGVYYGHPAAKFRGKEIFQIRKELGHELVKYYGAPETDIIIPNPDSGWGVTIGIFEETFNQLEQQALDFSKESEGILKIKDKEKYNRWRKLRTVCPALVRQSQAVRTFQEGRRKRRAMQVALKFGGIDSLLEGMAVDEGDDSTVKGSVNEGGSVWTVFNSRAKSLTRWNSYGPMFFPSFKEWHRGEECLHELAVQRAFEGDNPYDKTLEKINEAVAKSTVKKLKEMNGIDYSLKVRYNPPEIIKKVIGDGSFQALDASYPVEEKFWPGWLKEEVEKFRKYY